MSINTYRVVLALLYLGAVPVFIEEWAFKNNFHENAQLLDCKGVVLARKYKLVGLFSKTIRGIKVKLSASKQLKENVELCHVKSTSTALLSLTSGSTGTPKIADRSHEFLKTQFEVLTEVTKCEGTENVCVGLAVVVLFYLAQGSTVLLRTKKIISDEILFNERLKDFNVTQIVDSPAKLLNYAKDLNENNRQQIQKIFTGGGPVFPVDAKGVNNLFNKADINVIYGSTEVEPISVVSTVNILEQNSLNEEGLCVGEINNHIELRIVDLNTQLHQLNLRKNTFDQIEVTSESVGEIIVCGDHVLNQYYKSPQVFENQKIKVDGKIWHKTGDTGYVKNGMLFLTGPLNSIIKLKESFIFPFIIENKMKALHYINKGTVLKHDNKLVLVIELTEGYDKVDVKDLRFIDFYRVLLLSEIPMDVRHETKINYIQLKKIVKKVLEK
jgi:long-subunit acyl-CoA synthetase (AMP-forming)